MVTTSVPSLDNIVVQARQVVDAINNSSGGFFNVGSLVVQKTMPLAVSNFGRGRIVVSLRHHRASPTVIVNEVDGVASCIINHAERADGVGLARIAVVKPQMLQVLHGLGHFWSLSLFCIASRALCLRAGSIISQKSSSTYTIMIECDLSKFDLSLGVPLAREKYIYLYINKLCMH